MIDSSFEIICYIFVYISEPIIYYILQFVMVCTFVYDITVLTLSSFTIILLLC